MQNTNDHIPILLFQGDGSTGYSKPQGVAIGPGYKWLSAQKSNEMTQRTTENLFFLRVTL